MSDGSVWERIVYIYLDWFSDGIVLFVFSEVFVIFSFIYFLVDLIFISISISSNWFWWLGSLFYYGGSSVFMIFVMFFIVMLDNSVEYLSVVY